MSCSACSQLLLPTWPLRVVWPGQELLEGRYDMGGYEEYSGFEYRSAGCTEPYSVTE